MKCSELFKDKHWYSKVPSTMSVYGTGRDTLILYYMFILFIPIRSMIDKFDSLGRHSW